MSEIRRPLQGRSGADGASWMRWRAGARVGGWLTRASLQMPASARAGNPRTGWTVASQASAVMSASPEDAASTPASSGSPGVSIPSRSKVTGKVTSWAPASSLGPGFPRLPNHPGQPKGKRKHSLPTVSTLDPEGEPFVLLGRLQGIRLLDCIWRESESQDLLGSWTSF